MNKKWLWMLALMVAIGSVPAAAPVYAQTSETECDNGVDDDGDGHTDFPDDQDCENPEDNTEAGHSDGFGTVISIRYARKAAAFKGVVTAARQECIEQRRVVLRRRTPQGPRTIARTFTNDRGQWKVYWPDAARGRYFAVALRVEIPHPSGGTLVCALDRSLTIRLRG